MINAQVIQADKKMLRELRKPKNQCELNLPKKPYENGLCCQSDPGGGIIF